jgi:hypothetical protein
MRSEGFQAGKSTWIFKNSFRFGEEFTQSPLRF